MAMTIAGFNSLRHIEKWHKYKTINKGRWVCPSCNAELVDGPKRASPFRGCSVHCSNCEYELTRRTGGGMSDPFRWRLVAKNASRKQNL